MSEATQTPAPAPQQPDNKAATEPTTVQRYQEGYRAAQARRP